MDDEDKLFPIYLYREDSMENALVAAGGDHCFTHIQWLYS